MEAAAEAGGEPLEVEPPKHGWREMTIKVRFNQAKLISDIDCTVPIKVNGVAIFIVNERKFSDGSVGLYIETPPSAYGYADTPGDVLEVSEDMVLGYVRRFAKAFGVDAEDIEIEHELTAEQKAWLDMEEKKQ